MLLPASLSVPLSVRCRLLGFVGLLLLLMPPLSRGADDNYLREIEEEAKRQAATLLISQPQVTSASVAPAPVAPAPVAPAPQAPAAQLAPGLDRAAFERDLREKQPSAHASYQKLSATNQQQVYEAYRNDNRLSTLGERITQLLNAKP